MKPRSFTVNSLLISQYATSCRKCPPCSRICWLRTRSYSSTPEQPKRRYPGTGQPPRLKKWQRNFGIGGLVGGVAVLLYRIYSDKQTRDSFVTYKLVRKDAVSSTASIFYLEPEKDSKDWARYTKAWQQGIWNVQLKQPQLQIVRPYTPLPPTTRTEAGSKGQLRFLIRKDVGGGEVSTYLHRLPIGSQIELRGPNLEYEITPNVKHVVFFAGGTGIVPALQVAHALFGSEGNSSANDRKDRKLHILWANRKREDCVGGHSDRAPAEPLAGKSSFASIFSTKSSRNTPAGNVAPETQGLVVEELEQLKKTYPDQITVEYFVNEENTFINTTTACKALSRFDDNNNRRRSHLSPSTPSSSPSSSSSPSPSSPSSPSLSPPPSNAGKQAEEEREERQILISGPPGFISYLAGPKGEWRNGKEQQGGISKVLAHAIAMNPQNVKIWKI